MSFTIEVAALTDTGCVRSSNEDNYGYDPALRLYAICDGMGGMASGEVASGLAISCLLESFRQQSMPEPEDEPIPSVDVRLFNAIVSTNYVVYQTSQLITEHSGMGTTLVAACLDGDRLLLANVGDSRAYIIHEGQCMQVTSDHSYVSELVRAGSLTVEQAAVSDLQSVITRAIGASTQVEPDLYSLEPQNGDTVLLGSDGLTRYLNSDEIAAFVSAPGNPQTACGNLVALAKQRGGVDNITCLLLRFLLA